MRIANFHSAAWTILDAIFRDQTTEGIEQDSHATATLECKTLFLGLSDYERFPLLKEVWRTSGAGNQNYQFISAAYGADHQ